MNQKQLKRIRRELKSSDAENIKLPSDPMKKISSREATQQVAQGCDKRAIKIAKKLHSKMKANLSAQSNISAGKRDEIMAKLSGNIRAAAVSANDRHHHHNQKKTPEQIANSLIVDRA